MSEFYGQLPTETRLALEEAELVDEAPKILVHSDRLELPPGGRAKGSMLLITLMPDDSESMYQSGVRYPSKGSAAEKVMLGHNHLLGQLRLAPRAKRMLLQTRFLNGRLHNAFRTLENCRELAAADYVSSPAGTPLFTQTLLTLASTQLKALELSASGLTVSTATLIMSDGEATDETHDLRVNVSKVVAGMQDRGNHVIAALGIGAARKYLPTFKRMGVRDDLIFPADNLDSILPVFDRFREQTLALTSGVRHPVVPENN